MERNIVHCNFVKTTLLYIEERARALKANNSLVIFFSHNLVPVKPQRGHWTNGSKNLSKISVNCEETISNIYRNSYSVPQKSGPSYYNAWHVHCIYLCSNWVLTFEERCQPFCAVNRTLTLIWPFWPFCECFLVSCFFIIWMFQMFLFQFQ